MFTFTLPHGLSWIGQVLTWDGTRCTFMGRVFGASVEAILALRFTRIRPSKRSHCV